MRKLILTVFIFFEAFALKAQSKIDLQKPIFGIDPRTNYLKDKTKNGDPNDLMTTLPVYTTKEAAGFTFGPVSFTNGNDVSPDYPEENSVGFIVKSLTERTLVGIFIDIVKTEEAKKLAAYVNQKYGKGKLLQNPPLPNGKKIVMGTGAYLWKDIEPGVSMVMINLYGEANGKQSMATWIYTIQDDVKPNPKIEGFKTVLDKILVSSTRKN